MPILYFIRWILKDSEYVRNKLLENVISQLENDIVKSEMDGKYEQFGRMKATEQEPASAVDYEDEVDVTNIVPSIRDNEYMQHSTLWGAQYMSGWFNINFFNFHYFIFITRTSVA